MLRKSFTLLFPIKSLPAAHNLSNESPLQSLCTLLVYCKLMGKYLPRLDDCQRAFLVMSEYAL